MITTTAFDPIRRSFPNADIALLVREALAPLFSDDSRLAAVLSYQPKNRFFARLRRFRKQISTFRPDAVVHLHPEPALHLAAMLSGIPIRIGYRKGWLRGHTHALPYRRHHGKKHEALHNFDLLNPLGIEVPDTLIPSLNICFREDEVPVELGTGQPYVVLHPFAHGAKPTWPWAHFAKVANELRQRFSRAIVLVGDRDPESTVANILAATDGDLPPLINLVGRTNLRQLAAVLAWADLVISRDSGPAHLATALDTPTITLMGQCDPVHSPNRWKPLGPKARTIVRDLQAQPGESRFDLWKRCFTDIDPAEVMEAAAPILMA